MTQVGADTQKLVYISFRVPDPTRELQRKEAPHGKRFVFTNQNLL